MNDPLRDQLQRELSARQGLSVGAVPPVSAPCGDATVNVPVREAGSIGVAVDGVSVRRDAMDAAGARRACERVKEKVRYLLEPLEMVESDSESGETQMRSRQPTRDATGRHYYELQARPGELELKRYVKPDAPRESEPMELTREQLYRLAEDLADAAGAT